MVKRKLVQICTALLYNGNFAGFTDGNIWKGSSKNICLPGLNCYSCPGALGACPLGSLQSSLSGVFLRIPFYVLGPTSTIDMSIEKGEDIPIEQRPASEVTEMWYKQPMAPAGVKVYNPAFDFADHELISGIVTEYGIARPPYTESLKEIFRKKAEAQGKK